MVLQSIQIITLIDNPVDRISNKTTAMAVLVSGKSRQGTTSYS